MGAGKFEKNASKVRPGTYVNFETAKTEAVNGITRGTVLIPLTLNWGPVNEFVEIQSGNPNGQESKIGYNIYNNDPNKSTLMIREALKLADKVIFYRLNGGTASTGTMGNLTVTAKYPGTRGNNIRVVILNNPIGGKDLKVYLDTKLIDEQIGITDISQLKENDYVKYTGEGELTENGGTNLSTGSDRTKQNDDITKFLDDCEVVSFNCLVYPFDDSSMQTALKSKIIYFREQVGKKVTAVAPNFKADYEGIIGVSNGVILGDGTVVDVSNVCAWVAAADASATDTESNTYREYDGAIDVHGKKTNEQIIADINKGLFLFSIVDNKVVAEYDINTLTTFKDGKGNDYRKNRVRRVLDTFDETLQREFPPNKFQNSPAGWDLMESKGKQILILYRDKGAIKDVDLDEDFKVDRNKSQGDEAYLNIAISPIDSAEKLYFTVKTK